MASFEQSMFKYLNNIKITPLELKYQEPITISYYDEAKDREIEELNKQINEMAKFINKLDIDEEICSKVDLATCEKYNNGLCIQCIKKYFESL